MKLCQNMLVLFCIAFVFIADANAQKIVKQFSEKAISFEQIAALRKEFSTNKIIPSGYETQILIALSYFPELKNTAIVFRLKKANTPLSSRPKSFGLLQSAKTRKYIVTISEATSARLAPILFKNLNFNAQIGVLGHELSHVADYSTKGFRQMSNLLLIEIFSKNQVDSFERRTDFICIQHGLGYPLLSWSMSVRENLKTDNWRGANNIPFKSNKERYLNPETIIHYIHSLPLYSE